MTILTEQKNDNIFNLITSNALDHWRQPVESELTADFQSDWQAQLGGNGDTSGVSRMVLHLKSVLKIAETFNKEEQKLRERVCRFVSEIIRVDKNEALKLLNESAKSVKTACVMKLKNCNKTRAVRFMVF